MLRYSIPDATSIEVVADWVELYVSFLRSSLSKTELSSYIQASTGSEVEDSFLNDVWNTLRERVRLYGANSPIVVAHNLVESNLNWEEYPEYLACLIFSLEGNPNTDAASAAVAGKYFERISSEAIKVFLNGEAIVYGFPTTQSIEDVANNQLFERFSYLPPTYRKDRDLDIIAWKPWGDNRASQIILLAQCAAGQNWRTKLKDLNIIVWQKYINFAAQPIKGFIVPVVVTSPYPGTTDRDYLNEISTDAGIIIDRPRLYRQTRNAAFSDATLRPTVFDWCNNRMAELNA